jgi:hypothetical protein
MATTSGAFHRELDRFPVREVCEWGRGFWGRRWQWPDWVFALAVEPQHRATGDEDLDRRSRLHDLAQDRRSLEQMLEVVQHQEHPARAQRTTQGLERGNGALVVRAESGGDCRGHLGWIPQRRQIDKDDAVREGVAQAGCRRHGEASLTAARGARQSQQAHALVAQEPSNFADLLAASDQPRERDRQARLQARGRHPRLSPDRTTGSGQEYLSLTPDEP